ncbi:hypothetical protein STEG23_032056, partial [Scotinomys teguina]
QIRILTESETILQSSSVKPCFADVQSSTFSSSVQTNRFGYSFTTMDPMAKTPIQTLDRALEKSIFFYLLMHYQDFLSKIQPPTKPSVFIMKNGTNVACLVKDFYPKNVTISLQSSKKIAEFDPAIVISPSGKYSAVKLGQYGDSNSVTCSVQHNSETVHSTDFEPHENSLDNIKPTEHENATQTSETCQGSTVHTKKVNMMSLVVLGLRMLFAKSVAVNFLFTVKLFFF